VNRAVAYCVTALYYATAASQLDFYGTIQICQWFRSLSVTPSVSGRLQVTLPLKLCLVPGNLSEKEISKRRHIVAGQFDNGAECWEFVLSSTLASRAT
jgi:hypothetical protein